MTVTEILNEAADSGIYLYVNENKLKYTAKPGSFTESLKQQLAANKQEIIDYLVNEEKNKCVAEEQSRINLVDRKSLNSLPLSFAQQRLWFLDKLMTSSSVFNIPLALQLEGNIELDILESSLLEIICRHEVLRTRLVAFESGAAQLIEPPEFSLKLEWVASTDELKSISKSERNYQFDISNEKLCRIRLLGIQNEAIEKSKSYLLLITMHHSITDAWSMGIFLNELTTLYGAFKKGEESPLPSLPIQYVDYAVWQRDKLRGELLDNQLSYWREKLKGLPTLLTLPTDRPRPVEQSFRGGSEPIYLSNILLAKLKKLSLDNGVTLYMTLLSAFSVLMSQYSGQKDIAIGTPVANRGNKETESLIGFFVNSLVMRSDLSANPTFKKLLKQTREIATQAYAHQDVPFEQLVEELNPDRSLSYSPLFQVSFSLVNTPMDPINTRELTIVPANIDSQSDDGVSRYDLTFNLSESNSEISGTMEYNSDLFDRTTIQRMLTNYKLLLEAVTKEAGVPISEYQLLDPEEKKLQQFSWNNTRREFPAEKCIHELFELHANLSPEKIALVFNNNEITYGELNSRSNQVAHYLIAQGVKPEIRVGVCIERSIEMVIGILGILKAGGCYVPLDPNYPETRLEYMLNDSKCRIILSESYLLDNLSFLSSTKALPLDGHMFRHIFNSYSKNNVEPNQIGLCANNLAYINYTSGSTGTPKGSGIVHLNICRLIHGDFIEFSSERNMLCGASLSFDAITFELWGALAHGSKSVITDIQTEGLEGLGHLIDTHCVDCAWLTSALFNQIVNVSPDILRNLRYLLVGGEALSIEHVRKAQKHLPDTKLINGYGPTENTTFTCTYDISIQPIANSVSIPIGKPITNTQVYVLDGFGDFLIPGVIGELYTAGEGLARGYMQRPALTAEKFLPNPFSKVPGSRMYRTGDLVRYVDYCEGLNRNLEFVGRSDTQVKIRGFRIELSEIERAFVKHESIKEVVVLSRKDTIGTSRLVAYIVLIDVAQETQNLQQTLIEYIQTCLPDYMVPNALVFIPSIPLTANKKIDKEALPVADESAYNRSRFIAPSSPTEKCLAELWEKNLTIERVGIEDNYFSLGGDSIRSIALVAKAKESDIDFSVKDLFSNPTIKALSKLVDSGKIETTALEEVDNFALLSEEEKSSLFSKFKVEV